MRVTGYWKNSQMSLLIDIGREGKEREMNRGQGQNRAEDKLLYREERMERDTGG